MTDPARATTLEEILAIVEAEPEEEEPTGLEIVRLRCAGAFAGEVINGRFLKVPCNAKRCRIAGKKHTDHIYDLSTGRFRTVGDERANRSGG